MSRAARLRYNKGAKQPRIRSENFRSCMKAILSTLSGWRLLAVTPWVRARARLVGAHSTVEEGARARTQDSGKRSLQIRKTLKLRPNIHLVVAEMGLFRRGLLSMYSHHDSFRESQSLAQQKDSLNRIVYTERRDCDRISNDPVMLHFKFPLQSH